MIQPDDPAPAALIVAHGSPSAPEPQEAAMAGLAARVQARLPDWRIGGATLAAEGSFDAAVEALGRPVLYPFFMARGWFTGKVLTERAAPYGLEILAPYGVEDGLVAIAAAELDRHLAARDWSAADTTLLVAAHGSAVSKTSADSAYAFADALREMSGYGDTRCGFVEEPPFLSEAARDTGQAICLPYFALKAGHMVEDVPRALADAGFDGPVLPPFIDWPETPALIARSLARLAS